MNTRENPPTSLKVLQEEIKERYPKLPKRLKEVAAFALEHPNTMALETVSTIASQAGVNPSTLIRFANAFDYDGFSEMQVLFRQQLVESSSSYTERLKASSIAHATDPMNPLSILNEFSSGNISSIEHLMHTVKEENLTKAIALMSKADAIHIMGVRKAFSIVTYLAYSLRQLNKPAFLVDNAGSMFMEHAKNLKAGDLLISVSYAPYAQETRQVTAHAYNHNIPSICITDSMLSPLVNLANVVFEVKESESRGIRAMTASMCLAQSLVIGMATYIENNSSGSS